DRDHFGAGAEQGAGEAAGAGADFVDALPREIAGNPGDAVEQLLVEEEILAERLGGGEPVAGDDLPERGEAVQAFGHADTARRRAAAPAVLSAAIIAPGWAWPWPAMAKAVP